MKRAPKLPLVGLVMIVKDGENTLATTLDSVLPMIGTWTICDTGSTDSTLDIVEEKLGHLPGRLWHHTWHDFGRNLTMAFARAKDTADWLIRLDDDMTIEFEDGFLKSLRQWPDKVHALNVPVFDKGLNYRLPLLVRGSRTWRYKFPTHEYLDLTGINLLPARGVLVHHYGDKTSDDLLRDLELLKPLFRKKDPRAVFYVAQTHRFLGNYEAAVAAYELRTTLNGWDQEKWYAKYQLARIRGDIEGLFECWRERPWRHEPLTAASRIIGQAPAAEIDDLFVEQPI